MLDDELDSKEGVQALDRMLGSIEHVLLEEIEGRLCLSKATPGWFDRLADLGLGRSVMARLPFLDSFLIEARVFWERATSNGHIQSDFWTQYDIDGEEVHMLAYAVSMGGRRFLLVHPDDELYRDQESYQTIVHETTLSWRALKRSKGEMREAPPKLA